MMDRLTSSHMWCTQPGMRPRPRWIVRRMNTHRSSASRESVGPAAVAPIDTTSVRKQSWLLLILLAAAQFMVIIDATVVNVALPSIGSALQFATPAELQWVVTAYVLVTGGLTLLGGRIADLFNRRSLFLVGLVLFTAASLGTGLAPSPV